METKRCLIIAEAGVNHNGNLNTALELCDAAKAAGADIVKFQTWKTEKIITHNVKQAEYQTKNVGKEEAQFDMLKKLELPYDDFRKIKLYCDKIGIAFASTADEEESLDFLVDIGIPFIKVGSGDIGNISFLRYIGSKQLPVILSTGMSTLENIDISISALKEGGATDITVLHCTTNYPCPYNEVNLNAMLTIKNEFHLPVGYSDHTVGTEVPVAAVAMGACVIEKHFTLDKKMEGPDHAASMDLNEFKGMVQQIRNLEVALGDGIKRMTESEREIQKVILKRIIASKLIKSGEIFTEKNICIKRNDFGELASAWDQVIGNRAMKDYNMEEGILLKSK